MLLDRQELLSNAQAFAATGVSTDKYDTGMVSSKFGAGKAIGIGIFVSVAADFTTTDETYTFALCSDADSALGSPTVHESRAILAAALTAGSKHFIALDPTHDVERYIGLRATLAGTTPSVTITAALMTFEQFASWKAYPNNY